MCLNTGFVLSSLLIGFADILLFVVLSLFFRVLSKAARETGDVSGDCRIPAPYSPESKRFSIMLLAALLFLLAVSTALYFTRCLHVFAVICSAFLLAFFLVHWLYWQCFSSRQSFGATGLAFCLYLLALTWQDSPEQLWGGLNGVAIVEWIGAMANLVVAVPLFRVLWEKVWEWLEPFLKSRISKDSEDTNEFPKTQLEQVQQRWEKFRAELLEEKRNEFFGRSVTILAIAAVPLVVRFLKMEEIDSQALTVPFRIYCIMFSFFLFIALALPANSSPDESQLLDTERDYMGLTSLRMRQGKSSKEEDKKIFFQLFSHILYGSNLDSEDDCQEDWAIKTAVATLSSKEPCLALVGFRLFQEYRKEYRACFAVTKGEREFWKDYHEFYGALSVKLIEKEDFSLEEDSPDSLSLLRGLHETFQQSLSSWEWNQNLPRDYTWNNLHNTAFGDWLETDLKEDVKSGKTLCGLCLRDRDNCVEMNRAEREKIALRVIALYPVIIFSKIIRQVQEKTGDWQNDCRKRACEEYFKRLLSDPPALPHLSDPPALPHRFQALKADKVYFEYDRMEFPGHLHELSESPYIDAVKAAVKNAPESLKAKLASHKAREGSEITVEKKLYRKVAQLAQKVHQASKATVDAENKKIEDEQAIRELLCYLVARRSITGEGQPR